MFPDDDPRTAGLRMLRAGARATVAAIECGAPLRRIRGELLPAGLAELDPAPGEPDRPGYPTIRRALVATVERTFFEHHWQPAGA